MPAVRPSVRPSRSVPPSFFSYIFWFLPILALFSFLPWSSIPPRQWQRWMASKSWRLREKSWLICGALNEMLSRSFIKPPLSLGLALPELFLVPRLLWGTWRGRMMEPIHVGIAMQCICSLYGRKRERERESQSSVGYIYISSREERN
jgi:hypothetical protein